MASSPSISASLGSRVCLVLLLGLMTMAFSCEHTSGGDEAATPGADGSADETTACVLDEACESFYRCIESTCQVPPAMSGKRDEDTPVLSFFSPDAEMPEEGGEPLASFYTELALTAAEQSRGLMYRPHMRDDWGMLFVYPAERSLSFWMKNTLIPLDMIFIDDAGEVVGVVEMAEPQTLSPRRVDRPARYVFEINGGLSAELGIGEGTRVRFEHMEGHHTPRR
ncbi:DUF192 domain-containing protein [Lujinxingia vulgaris]|uniref:DUF192 domain-containing protein n=1 Tax=Lujinxingia vulgaris TaxID=2600176 RepID=A0A5C6XGH7_9DELT|nr:DUF192 domain-containing protein [Lujinxingia vulgaris]TXD38533.1 DUF192 domain-containing protein [Lujinxingia vulgaris]